MTDINKKPLEEKVEELERSYIPLSLSTIQAEVADIEREETWVVDGVTNEVIKYNPVFDQEKINEILVEMREQLKYAEANKINFPKSDYELTNYLYFLIIKKFTHFRDEISDDLETQIVQMDAMVRLGYFELIIGQIFNPKEIYRVLDKVMDMAEYGEKVKKAESDTKKKVTALENKVKAVQKSSKTKPKTAKKK